MTKNPPPDVSAPGRPRLNLLLTGASGFLGTALRPSLARLGPLTALSHHAQGPGLRSVDIRDADTFRRLIDMERPDVIVLAAAYREPDFCEDHPEETARLNVEPVHVACAAAPAACRMVLISSDYVFDGEHPPHAEDAPRRPLSEYGRSKVRAEDVVLARPGSLVVRVPLLVGADASGAPTGFLRQLVEDLRARAPVIADDVLVRYPTWTRDAAAAIAFLIERGATGVVHYSGPDAVTRYGAFRVAATLLGLSHDHIRPSQTVVPRRAGRPRNSQLDTTRIRAMGFRTFTPLTQVLRAVIARG